MSNPAISCDIIITSIRTRSDNSLGLSVSTPDLNPDEQLAFLQLKNRNLKALIQPLTETPSELKEVRGEFDRKSPSQRLRAVLYLLWKQQESTMPYDEFYLRHMNKLIETHKAMLEPSPH